MNDLLKKLGLSVDVNIDTQEVNKSIYTLGTVAIVVILIYNYTK